MPLIKNGSKEAISENIRTLMHEGRKQDQAIAIAYSEARKHRGKKKKSSTLKQAGKE